MSNNEELMKNLVTQYIIDATQLEGELVKVIVNHSSFPVLLREEFEFVGHYSLEYWGEKILEETIDVLTTKLKLLSIK